MRAEVFRLPVSVSRFLHLSQACSIFDRFEPIAANKQLFLAVWAYGVFPRDGGTERERGWMKSPLQMGFKSILYYMSLFLYKKKAKE